MLALLGAILVQGAEWSRETSSISLQISRIVVIIYRHRRQPFYNYYLDYNI